MDKLPDAATNEEWRPVPSVPEYEVSSLGHIRHIVHVIFMKDGRRRRARGKAWKGAWDKDQERYILVVKGRGTFRVARMICEAFNGQPPFPNCDTLHLDEDSRNNMPKNLEWNTRKANLNCPIFKGYAARACILKMAGIAVKGVVPKRIPF